MTTKKDVPYVERLRSELLRSVSLQEKRTAVPLWRRSRWVLAAAGMVLFVGAVSAIVLTGTGAPSEDAPGPTDGGVPGPALASCVERFSVENLAGRDFAFDGTIAEIVPPGGAETETGGEPAGSPSGYTTGTRGALGRR